MIMRVLGFAIAAMIAGSAHAQQSDVDLKIGYGYLPKTAISWSRGGLYEPVLVPSLAVGLPLFGNHTDLGVTYIPVRKADGVTRNAEIKAQIMPTVAVSMPVDVDLKLGFGYLPKMTELQPQRPETKFESAFAPSLALSFPFSGYKADFGFVYVPTRKGVAPNTDAKTRAQFMPTLAVAVPFGQ